MTNLSILNNRLTALAMCLSALTLSACATHTARPPEVARLGCDQLPSDSGNQLAPGKVTAVSRVTRTEFHARALQPQRTIGADFYVRAEPGVTAEYLERALTCHAQAGQPLHANDPLHPGNGQVTVDVRTAHSGFAVRATGSTAEVGTEIWRRAESFTRPGVQVEQIASSAESSNL